jgi:SAM-dependent methyltransferase
MHHKDRLTGRRLLCINVISYIMPLAFLHKPIYERRITVLSQIITNYLHEDDKVLDIGSGSGALAHQISQFASEQGIKHSIEGLEKFARGNEKIKTTAFDGYNMPYEDNYFDITILADVVHHEEDYMRLLQEAVRVTKRYLIIKDHKAVGILGHQRICLMDWAANNPYGVKCLYRYFSSAEWHSIYTKLGLTIVDELNSMRLYQQPFNLIFGNQLQYFSVLEKNAEQDEM